MSLGCYLSTKKKITDPYQILLTFPSYIEKIDRIKVYLTKKNEENMKICNKKLLRDL